jgi:dTDP-4-amino-4,6-dideoxygalactose transaminase
MRHTNDCSDRLLRLPLWPDMTEGEIDRVIDVVQRSVRSISRAGAR